MKKLKNMMIVAVATIAMTSSSFAFEGFSVGGVFSYSTFDTSGKETKGQAGGTNEASAVAKKSSDVDIGSVFAEYTFSQGSSIGLEYIPGESSLGARTRSQTQTNGQNVTGVITAKAEVSDHVTFYVEPTVMLSDTFGVYVKGGASRVTVNSLDSQTSTTISGTYGNQDVYGTTMGFGAKAYKGNFFAKLEYMETEYGRVSLTSSTNKQITADIESEATRVAVGYDF